MSAAEWDRLCDHFARMVEVVTGEPCKLSRAQIRATVEDAVRLAGGAPC